MLALTGKLGWLLMVTAWYVIRLPHERKAKREQISRTGRGAGETLRMLIAGTGLGVAPAIFFWAGFPARFSYQPSIVQLMAGAIAGFAALRIFWLTHQALGEFWSVSLDLKQKHRLVTHGIYQSLRHPMYTGFWLMALGQALLLANWIAGLAGLSGFAFLFFTRIGPEEKLMESQFGQEYRDYCQRTWRIIPHVW